ncbi:hypothetical protein V8F33_005054, partial [Rhypophila sp. PSN 637]
FFILIDGLDEYQDPEGLDQYNVVQMLCKWAPGNQSNVKLCVSSREEPAFCNRFPLERTLRLHEFTRYVMQRYARDLLQQIQDGPLLLQLIQHIPIRPERVSLWIHLVVRELSEDIEAGPITPDVSGRFPAGLQPLVDRTLHRINPRYTKMAYLTFSMLQLAAKYDLPLFDSTYSFLEDYCDNPEFTYHMPILGWQVHHRSERSDVSDPRVKIVFTATARKRLRLAATKLAIWCKGLVVISETLYMNNRLDFAHRSILEYLTKKEPRTK